MKLEVPYQIEELKELGTEKKIDFLIWKVRYYHLISNGLFKFLFYLLIFMFIIIIQINSFSFIVFFLSMLFIVHVISNMIKDYKKINKMEKEFFDCFFEVRLKKENLESKTSSSGLKYSGIKKPRRGK